MSDFLETMGRQFGDMSFGCGYKHPKKSNIFKLHSIKDFDQNINNNKDKNLFQFDISLTSQMVIHVEKTFGNTIGNSLRRILLEYIPGLAVVGFHIENCQHILDNVDGMKEVLPDFIAQLRKLVFKINQPFEELMLFKAKIVKKSKNTNVVKASDIECQEGLEVLNKDLDLFSLDIGKDIVVDLLVTHGSGYVKSSDHEFIPFQPTGFISIDSFFSPVLNVKYDVSTETGGSTIYDVLTIDIKTNGSIKPIDVMLQALEILVSSATKIYDDIQSQISKKESGDESVDATCENTIEFSEDQLLHTPINELKDLDSKVLKVLLANNIKTLNEVIQMGSQNFQTISGLGKKYRALFIDYLKDRGLSFEVDEVN